MKIEIREVAASEIPQVKMMVNRAFASDLSAEIRDTGFFSQLKYMDIPNPEYFRALFVEGQPATALMAVPFVISIGCVPFKIGGYTGMATDRNFRGKGLASQLLVEYEKFLNYKGYDGIALHSAADMLYKKHGFEMIFGTGQFSIESQKLKKIGDENNNYSLKIFGGMEEVEYLTKITSELYQNHKITQPDGFDVLKTLRFWHQNLILLLSSNYSVSILYEKEAPIAYGIYSVEKEGETLKGIKFPELIAKDNNSDTLGLLLKKVSESYGANIPISGEYQHFRTDLKRLMDQMGGKLVSTFASANMFHIIDLLKFMKKLIPEFIRRLEDTNSLFNKEFILNISDKDLNLKFLIQNNIVSINEIEQSNVKENIPELSIENELFYNMLFGTYPPLEILEDCEFKNTDYEKMKDIIQTLFTYCAPIWPSIYHY